MVLVKKKTKGAKKAKSASRLIPEKDTSVVDETLRSFGKRNMTTYSIAVNLDRSVPDLYDGLKPVQRRILYGASKECPSKFGKTARLVGHVLGAYHPHGDLSIASAVETMVNHPTPTIQGRGNWGSMVDNAAAVRYTNCRLSEYGRSFFDPNYISDEVTSFVPNYDDKDVEPVTLPAQLPNVLLNGGEGIGVGITTVLPTFTPESMIEILERLFKGEKLEAVDFSKTLKFNHKWGGHLVPTKENKQQWMQLFKTSQANIQFESELQIDRDSKKIVIDDWPPGTNLETFVRKVRAMPECLRCYNSAGVSQYTIECKKDFNYDQFDKFVGKVRSATRQRKAFKVNVTKREAKTVDGITTFETEFLALSVPKLIMRWCKMRVDLELKSLAYRIKKVNVDIDYSKTLIHACDHIDRIIKIIKSSDKPEEALVKALKIKPHQAKWICDLQLRRISKLDNAAYKAKLKEQLALLKQLEAWQKKPKSKILLDIANVKQAIVKDRSYQNKEDTEELEVVA